VADRLVIEGGVPLRGDVHGSAAKNAALPRLAGLRPSAEPVVLENVRHLADIGTIRALLARLGAEFEDRDASTVARTPGLYHLDRGYERMKQKLAGLGARIRRET
jgi:UDP-N-acetylglucosamine 1-carboxyvinyltransferase